MIAGARYLSELTSRARRPLTARRLAAWQRPVVAPAEGPPFAEIGILSALVTTHVLDHRVVPKRIHVATHLATAAATIGAALASGASLSDLGLAPDRALSGLKRGLLVSAAITSVLAFAGTSRYTRHLFADERVGDHTASDIAMRSLVEIPLGTALSEELIFRGAVLGLAMRRMPAVPAVVVTSGLFGLWHVLPSLSDRDMNPLTETRHPVAVTGTTVAVTTVAGLMFSYERLRTGSIVAPVLTHTATNVATFLTATVIAHREGSER